MATATAPQLDLGYKGPQRRRTRARVATHGDAGRRARLRKWAAFHSQAAPGTTVPADRQVAVDLLALLDELAASRQA